MSAKWKLRIQIDLDPGPPLWPYQIYMDRNSRSGSAGRHHVCSMMTLDETVAECQRITRDDLLELYAPHMPTETNRTVHRLTPKAWAAMRQALAQSAVLPR